MPIDYHIYNLFILSILYLFRIYPLNDRLLRSNRTKIVQRFSRIQDLYISLRNIGQPTGIVIPMLNYII